MELKRLGQYDVVSLLGSGGMGEVYRAHDTKLGRDVAIKILPQAFTTDSNRLTRFEREARVLASLNHPHIGAIYGVEQTDGLHGLVLELVEGETLADRLRRGPIPITEALTIARQIADALDAAHEKGIVHRDLKPANVKITPAGVVKVLDFGLAKEASGDDGADASTRTMAGTKEGTILGTAAYMSPEQSRGQGIDKRTDIWAFGCVLYEMLTGRPAFARDTLTDTLAAIVDQEVTWDALPDRTPPPVIKLLHRCLAKDRRQRLSDAAHARLELDDALNTPAAQPAVVRPGRAARAWRPAVGLAIGAILIGGLLLAISVRTRQVPPRVARLTIVPSAAVPLTLGSAWRSLTISPDGARVVYLGAQGALVVRALDQLAPTTLTGLGARAHPIFSPDGLWIAFFDANSLKKVAATGGSAVTVTSIRGFFPTGASWGSDDTIVFSTTEPTTGLLRVAAGGGEPEVLTTPDRAAGEFEHHWPEILPDNKAVLFTLATPDDAHVAVLDLRTRAWKVLIRGGRGAHYVAPGYLIYGDRRSGTLLAVRFDLTRLEVVGAAVPVGEGVATTILGAQTSVAADGTLVYVPDAALKKTLVWVNRQGRREPLGAPARTYRDLRLSPDGTQVVVSANDREDDLWLWDLASRNLSRLTAHGSLDYAPVWTPDGRRLVWTSGRASPTQGGQDLYMQAADGSGAVEPLMQNQNYKRATSITPDGTLVVLSEDRSGTGTDLMLLTLEGAHTVTPLLVTPFTERNGEVSPDAKWLAYESNETGQFEIHVRPFPGVDASRWQVSTGGGTQPLWARSGRELFYRGPNGEVLGVRVQAEPGRFRTSTPATLFEGRDLGLGIGAGLAARNYDVTPDGTRFLMIKDGTDSDDIATPVIVVVQHWVEELKRLLPSK